MGTIASPATSVAVSGVLLLVGIALPIDSTRAEDACATAPGAAAPAGQHWYYRIDRATHRKCWFMHAIVPLSAHTAAEPADAASIPPPAVATPQWPSAATPQGTSQVTPQATSQATGATTAPQAPANASPAGTSSAQTANAPSEATGTLPAPHITVLNVKPGSAPFAGPPPSSQASASEPTAEPQMPQMSPGLSNVPGKGDLKPANRAAAVPAPSATDAAPDALAHDAASASAPTQSNLFFVVDLALGIAAALIVLVGKMAGLLRTPRLSDHPDDVWRRRVVYQDNSPSLAPQAPQGPTDLDMLKPVKRSPPVQADLPAGRLRIERPASRRVDPAPKGSELEWRTARPARRSSSRA